MLDVHSDYLSHESLASYYVKTPDPRINHPPVGQRLIISWSLPNKYLCYPDLHLLVTLRFRNREEVKHKVPITKTSGTRLFCLMNEEYCEKGGIATYRVLLQSEDCVLEEWRHQLWAELITFDVADINQEM